jgi:hypothetical protein
MSENDENARSNAMAQWIVSLAVSIVCCACLFVVLAFYITDQHITVSTVSLRMDLLQQRQDRLTQEIDMIRHANPTSAAVSAPAAAAGGVVVDKAPAEVAPTPEVPSKP